jgi:hypothetical protein
MKKSKNLTLNTVSNFHKKELYYQKFLERIQTRAKYSDFYRAIKLALADYSGSIYRSYYVEKLKEDYPEVFI